MRLLQSALGALAGGGMLFFVSVAGRFLFRREAMGGGDIKMLAAFGTVLGYEGVAITFFVASIVGGMVAAPLLITGRMKRHSYLPFGPFLNLGCFVALFYLLKKIS
jgi:leader peptidase (prepilin peptidase)/N-methyltransferase